MPRPAFGRDVRDTASEIGAAARGVGGIADGNGHTRIPLNVAHLLLGLGLC